MNHKRNRSQKEKIEAAIERVNNIHPDLRDILINELASQKNEVNLNCVQNIRRWINSRLSIPEMGIQTKEYWIARGWSETEAYFKSKEKRINVGRMSPYSKEFWMSKINPATGIKYTEEEADFERNSRRPIRKEYWLVRGFSEEESEIKAKETKDSNNKNNKALRGEIRRLISPRCQEYWIDKGFSEEDAELKVSESQATFSLNICIEKYGEEIGRQKWLDRQEAWQNTLNSKSQEEKDDICARKSTKVNFKSLWNQELDCEGYFYIIQIDENTFKIGITTRKNITKRYGIGMLNDFNVLKFEKSTINHVFQIEQILKSVYKHKTEKDNEYKHIFGWTETFFDIDRNELLELSNNLFENIEQTQNTFNEKFKRSCN